MPTLTDEMQYVRTLENDMVALLTELCSVPAIGPVSGGEGELDKAELLQKRLGDLGFKNIERFDVADSRVKGGVRPNVIVTLPGKSDELVWVVTHMDIVPPGDLGEWTSDPYKPEVRDGKLYGRGTEDNGQELVASVFAAKALLDNGVTPSRTVKLCFVSDEETGSEYGIQALIDAGKFSKDDIIIVPDYGVSDSSLVEVGEKSILWMKVVVKGKQAHASTPQRGVNAHRIGYEVLEKLDRGLPESFPGSDELFEPPVSTFEPTKKEGNSASINTIPGEDVFYLDCRLLPAYTIDEVITRAQVLADSVTAGNGGRVSIETVMSQVSPPKTPPESRCVVALAGAIKEALGIEPKIKGVGGGTCASWFRAAGLPAVVWATQDEKAHEPDEYARIENMVRDAMVFYALFR